ncbi:hypothetical protein [Agrococcus baldri]|uniref:hypothetical protein n=1 Tax=Agrococcus baldri TaxID=153730 RepID=UPI000B893019|nr:hypothetical protein [Agrococcus baldri]
MPFVVWLAMTAVANTVVNVFIAHFLFMLFARGDTSGDFVGPPALIVVTLMLLLLDFCLYLGRYPRFDR